jgi:hypothetical protein
MKIQEERKVVRLKKPLLGCAVLLGAAMGLQATPVCPTTGTYATLQALGSCTIAVSPTDVLTFSGFTYSDSAVGAVPVTAANLTYTTMDSSTSAIGFLFGVALTAGPSQVNDLGIGYTVTGSGINDATVTMAGLAVGSGASASIAETICPGSTIAGCLSSLPLSTYTIAGGPTQTSDTTTFAPVGTLGVLKDVDVLGGGGLSSISLFTDTVSQGGSSVPEPGFYGVLAGGMGAVLMFARRRKKAAKA